MDREVFAEKLKANLAAKNEIIAKIYGAEPFDYEIVLQEYLAYADRNRVKKVYFFLSDERILVSDRIEGTEKNFLYSDLKEEDF